MWLDDPQQAANHMAFGMSLDNDKKLNLKAEKSVYNWV
jgi:hypothetical protein